MVTRMNRPVFKQHPAKSGYPKRVVGFTLLEVLTVITIVAILMALGVPSYQYVTNANRISGEVNALLGDMQYARSEAIKEGQTVSVCSSANPTAAAPTCAGGTTGWQSGWIVFADVNGTGAVDSPSDTILRVQRPFPLGDTFNASGGNTFVIFNREGFAVNLKTPPVTVTLHAAVPVSASTRCLQITIVGQVKSEIAGQGACS
jgi:type IV fimbrial biogenesis protein FimT